MSQGSMDRSRRGIYVDHAAIWSSQVSQRVPSEIQVTRIAYGLRFGQSATTILAQRMTTKEQAHRIDRDPLSSLAAALFDRAELRPGDMTGYLRQQSVNQHRLFAFRHSPGIHG
jgi:hypothetical protein